MYLYLKENDSCSNQQFRTSFMIRRCVRERQIATLELQSLQELIPRHYVISCSHRVVLFKINGPFVFLKRRLRRFGKLHKADYFTGGFAWGC
jgi:hypothetical protein